MTPSRSARALPFLGWAAYAGFHVLFAFQSLALRSDDFGYMRGVIGTLQRGRPFTYDWLEPYGAAMSTLCAIAYRLTGSFAFSTWGLLAVCASLSFLLLLRLLCARLPTAHAVLIALAVAASPLYFVKAGDFHGLTFTLPLFLAALLAWESGVTWLFFLFAFLAFANRQSHVALLVLPLLKAGKEWRAGGRPPVKIAAGLLLWVTAALLLHFSMNHTWARDRALAAAPPPARATEAFLAGLFIAAATLGAFQALLGSPRAVLRANLRHPLIPLFASLALAVLGLFWPSDLIHFDTPFFGAFSWERANRFLPWFLIPALWFVDFRAFRFAPYLVAAAAYLPILCLRGFLWDYYFAEMLLLVLLAAAERPGASLSRAGAVLLALVLAANTAYAYLIRVSTDKQIAAVRTFEGLERRGEISVTEMSGAPFGYLGWKLFDYYLAHDGRSDRDPAAFIGYVRRDRIRLETELPWRRGFPRPLAPSARVIASGKCRVGFVRVECRAVDDQGNSQATLKLDGYQPVELPLSDSEWTSLLNRSCR